MPTEPPDPVSWAALRRDRILHEDDHALVIDKPAGISVLGERHGTDLVRLAAEAGEVLVPAHRIDKVTSGVVLCARTQDDHGPLTRQFADRSARKQYLAVVRSTDLPDVAVIDLPLQTAGSGRVRVAAPRGSIAFDPRTGRYRSDRVDGSSRSLPSTTVVQVVDRGRATTLVSAWPLTGRRHQIRVHLAWTGHPVAGDPLFRTTSGAGERPRAHLHALRLSVVLPWLGGETRTFEAPPDAGFLSGHDGRWRAEGGPLLPGLDPPPVPG